MLEKGLRRKGLGGKRVEKEQNPHHFSPYSIFVLFVRALRASPSVSAEAALPLPPSSNVSAVVVVVEMLSSPNDWSTDTRLFRK